MDVASDFDILPAIDLRGGQVVRLVQGDFARETAFSADPVAVARRFVAGGARWLHVVDLDGARDGAPAHRSVIAAIVAAVGDAARVEVAGGLRDDASVAAALEAGAARVVIGTAALEDPSMAGRAIRSHGADRIVIAVDVRAGSAVGGGWAPDAAGLDAAHLLARLADVGATVFEVTAIERDGLLVGPDIALYEQMVGLERGAIIASAGIATVDHLRAVRAAGCQGAIVGRALYDGSLALAEALAAGA
jgi:phosphoribosylformimino-5-aminoimidazole carboxamide ribotide isomerase